MTIKVDDIHSDWYQNEKIGEIANAVNGLIDLAPSALSAIVSKMQMNVGNCNILVSSDSTGNEQTEWVYLYAQYLATLSSQYTVNYYLFNAVSGEYGAAVVVQTGSGANSLNIYNAAISGSKPDYILGSRFTNAVISVPQIDCLIMNHGHNCINSYNDATPDNRRTPQFLEAVFQILSVHSGASVVFMTQNPRRDDDNYRPVYAAILRAASLVGASIADSYKLFADAGKATNLYNDNIHPSPAGSQLYLSAIKTITFAGQSESALSAFDNWGAYNLIENGTFKDFSGAIPAGWTAQLSATAEKELTQSEGLNGYSVKVISANASSGIIYTLSNQQLNMVKGRNLTLAVRVFIPTSQSNNAGRIGLTTSSNTSNNYAPSGDAKGGWTWRVISQKVKPTDAYVIATLFGDTAGANGFAYFDRAILVTGALPADCIK